MINESSEYDINAGGSSSSEQESEGEESDDEFGALMPVKRAPSQSIKMILRPRFSPEPNA